MNARATTDSPRRTTGRPSTYAERLGAHAQTAVLTARLGSVLIDSGEAERGERLLRDVLEQGHGARNEAMPAARLFLAMWLGRTGRLAEARAQMAPDA